MESVAKVKREACFGCTACMAICKFDAITMQPDDEGFMVPIVDEEKCIGCGACTRVCPALNPWQGKASENKFYAYQHENMDILAKSTSGGAFSALVGTEEKPYVCGCVLDEKLYVRHILSREEKDIAAMRGSKYVQSDMGNVLREIREKLLVGEKVVFSGTSCQTHGLLNYLAAAKVPTDNLLTMDLICHGVPSNLMHQEYVKLYEQAKGVSRCKHYFRSKRQGWGLKFMLKNHEQLFVHGGHKQTVVHSEGVGDRTSLESQLWLNVFFSDLCLRESCYNCPYCTDSKPADITLADFWGIEETDVELNFPQGCSLLIARGKGIDKVDQLLNSKPLDKTQEVVARKYQIHLQRPIKRPENRENYWRDYQVQGFEYVAKKYLRYGWKYNVLMVFYNLANMFDDKRVAQKLGNWLFY
ncbi:MAG: Coenzyme F420 hydrogenase/dehydrogenase, beta subunit C-terminal domain [Butyrivibrio sp.]|nr:Coenzyme F420 hydrogenase/dehydrogenase, beta subunit C-terminal domain [Butyrivibrio sp.]